MTLKEPIARIGQLVFGDNNSDEVQGIIVDHDDTNLYVTVMLFEPHEGIPAHYNKILKESLTEEEQIQYFHKCEDTWPGYLKWFTNIDPNDIRIGCPIK